MSSIAVEESPFSTFISNIENALFSVIYNIQKTRKDDLVRVNYLTGIASIILDFIQLVPFMVHGYGYGTLTLTWGRFLRYVQLQIGLTDFSSFAVFFWISAAVIFIIVANAGFLFYSFWKNTQPNPISLLALNVSFNVVLHFCFIAGYVYSFSYPCRFKLLMTPWWCNPNTQNLFPFEFFGENVGCWSSQNMIFLIVGSIFAVILIAIMMLASYATVNLSPVPFDLFAVTTPVYRMAYYGALIFMTIDENLIALAIPVVGRWWEALFNWIIMTALLGITVYYLPFQLKLGNQLRAGVLTMCWWISACTFVTVNMRDYVNLENHIIDYILLAGLIPAFFMGYCIINERYTVFHSLSTALIKQIESKFNSNEIYRAKYSKKIEEEILDGHRNPYLYLPKILQKIGADCTCIEIIGRLLWHNNNDKTAVEAAYRLYRCADSAYPDIAFMKFLRANCFIYLSVDSEGFNDLLDDIKNLQPEFYVRFLCYKLDQETKIRGTRLKKEDDRSFDLFAYLEFQKYYTESKKNNEKAIASIRDFWSLFLQTTITISQFNRCSREIELTSQKALASYKTILVRYPKHIYILSSYAYFLDLVMHNSEEAAKYHRRADRLRARENDENGFGDGGSEAAIISISEDGTIEQVNKTVTDLFGWQRIELIGRNIKMIVPSPYKEKHDQFLDRYKTSGNAKVIGQPPRALFGLHREGYAIGVALTVQERRKENGERSYVGSLIQTDIDATHGKIIINEEGIILLVTKNVLTFFGYTAEEVIRVNVTIFMLDAFASNHESYLRRYKETGEARVIGTAGRNVPARRKNATVFPASLNVIEEYISGERFYTATMYDTTSITATIYIDGFGTVQNTDAGIGILLGYHKEDIAGKNIKDIMPPPYNDFHDMYLERYRRTKISNILRSTEGRILPAVHSDGTLVNIRAIVTRCDDGSGGNASMLFKGVIKRYDNIVESALNSRHGFTESQVIELKKDGTITHIDISVLKMLGYPKDINPKIYVGQPIEVLVPPLANNPRQAKDVWMAKALGTQELNFYLLMLAKNLTPFPVTYSLSIKGPNLILMRVRDILSSDALITIDEVGTILSSNEDSFMLLGYEPDEIAGRNIKEILAKDVSDNHDGYLLRYKETRVARVVGIARVLTTPHRDGSILPVEIQVTELKTADGNNFIGRIRHLAIDDRIESDWANSFFTSFETSEMALDIDLNASKGSRISKKDGTEVLSNSAKSEEIIDYNNYESESDSNGSSDDSESEESEKIIDSAVESKLLKVINSESEDPAIKKLGLTINTIFAFIGLILAIALIASNVLQNPISHFEFLDQLDNQVLLINGFIYTARTMYFIQLSDSLLVNMTANTGAVQYWPCTFGAPYTIPSLNSTLKTCDHIAKFNASQRLIDIEANLQISQLWFSANYPKIQVLNDELDSVYGASFTYNEFNAGSTSTPTNTSISGWNDFVTSKILNAAKILKDNYIINGNAQTRLEFTFLQYNRNLMISQLNLIRAAVFEKVRSILIKEALLHLVIAILLSIFIMLGFFIFLVPCIRQVQLNRLIILKLLLFIPKAVVWDFVYQIYKDDTEDDENTPNEISEENAQNEAKARAKILRSEDSIEIKNDSTYGLYLFIGLTLSLVALPSIIHCAWRYSFNTGFNNLLNQFSDISSLFGSINSLAFRAAGIWAPCNFRPSTEKYLCGSIIGATTDLKNMANTAYTQWNTIQNQYTGSGYMETVLYTVNQQKNIFSECTTDTVQVPVNTVLYDYPTGSDLSKSTTTISKSVFRCNDSWVNTNRTPILMRMPNGYSIHNTHGLGIYLHNSLQSAFILSETKGFNTSIPPFGPIDYEQYWNLIESADNEGAKAMLYFKTLIRENVIKEYKITQLGFNVSYAFSLCYAIILFGIVYNRLRADFVNESRQTRGILFMVPIDIVAKSKPIVDYIDRVFSELVE